MRPGFWYLSCLMSETSGLLYLKIYEANVVRTVEMQYIPKADKCNKTCHLFFVHGVQVKMYTIPLM